MGDMVESVSGGWGMARAMEMDGDEDAREDADGCCMFYHSVCSSRNR